ncbi:MAG TPA: hypothetical protein VGD14_09460 [bacterium]
MISPTGKGIRNDEEGSGEYGASRGNRIHNGIDYLCDDGQIIIAPFALTIERESFPKLGSPLSGILWRHDKTKGKMFYFKPHKHLIGQNIRAGDAMGIAQSVSKDYGLSRMKDHIHFQIDG